MNQAIELARKNVSEHFPIIDLFLDNGICYDLLPTNEDYIKGKHKIKYFANLNRELPTEIEEKENDMPYEEFLESGLKLDQNTRIRILVGGLGSGKTTAVKWILNKIAPENHYIYINCIGEKPKERIINVLQYIYGDIIKNALDRIILKWVNRKTIEELPDKIKLNIELIRRLMILYNVKPWANLYLSHSINILNLPTVFNGKNILNEEFKDDDIDSLINLYKEEHVNYDEIFNKIFTDDTKYKLLASSVLYYYLSQIPKEHQDQRILIIDNLDQLPTEDITLLGDSLHSISTHCSHEILIFIPMRPSSIDIHPNNFVAQTKLMYHYGPDCFELVLKRLEKYILNREKEDLKEFIIKTVKREKQDITINDRDIKIFIFSSYVYALVMRAGYKLHNNKDINITLSGSNEWLNKIIISNETAMSLANILAAKNGYSGRYSLVQLSHYFKEVYHSEWLANIWLMYLNDNSKNKNKRYIHIPYKSFITNLLFDSANTKLNVNGVNVYKPVESKKCLDKPSLITLRILKYLFLEQGCKFNKISSYLGSFGIPYEQTIDVLNNLHNKRRLLIWLSRNYDLDVKEDLKNIDIVISEHGESYVTNLITQFEYIWACASEIHNHDVRKGTFLERLQEYVQLIQELKDIEIKQICYKHLSTLESKTICDIPIHREMITLWILYISASNAIISSVKAVSATKHRTKNLKDVEQYLLNAEGLIEKIIILIIETEKDYNTIYGGYGYYNVYSKEIEELNISINKYIEKNPNSINYLSALIEKRENDKLLTNEEVITTKNKKMYETDFVTTGSRLLRYFIAYVEPVIKGNDRYEELKININNYKTLINHLSLLFEKQIPKYTEVEENVNIILDELESILQCCKNIGITTGLEQYKWFLRQKQNWFNMQKELIINSYGFSEKAMAETIDLNKYKMNNLLNTYLKMIHLLEIQEIKTIYHDAKWSL